ncbi:MAG: hypothetical protein KC583_09245, partial [Myxococcales bacterium]|nr:hypothetical protein [Myxococcales bacterium]
PGLGGTPAAPGIVGRWLSEGADLAPLLADPPASIRRIEATFGGDGRFRVVLTNDDLQSFELSGTYTTDPARDPATITLSQAQPEAVRSTGIYRVDGDVLTYEVAQTDPPLAGVTPPDAAAGFGSTNNGALGEANVQTYRRQP